MNEKPLYTLIPNKALDALIEKGHSNAAVLVYQVLCRHYNLKSQQCWPSLNTIAKLSGLDKRNVSRSLKTLSSSGMILRTQSKSTNNSFDRNTYYLPHYLSFQIESLQSEKKSSANTKALKELKELEHFILKSITDGRGTLSLGSGNMPLGRDRKAEGRGTKSTGVEAQSPTNNTIINTTINITKNVNSKEAESNEDLTSGLKQLKRYDNEFSKVSTEAIGKSSTLIKIKREGLVQQLAQELNDEKSIPFFRSLVSKFTDHEDMIYKCLSLTRETQEMAGIKTSRGAVFTDHIKREAVQLGIEL